MSTEIAEFECEHDGGSLRLTQFGGGFDRGLMLQVSGPSGPGRRPSWLTLSPRDARELGVHLLAWAADTGDEETAATDRPHESEPGGLRVHIVTMPSVYECRWCAALFVGVRSANPTGSARGGVCHVRTGSDVGGEIE